MDIHFCDLCNESVPQADLNQGRAFVRNGRVVCATCDRVMTTIEAPAGAEERAGRAPGPGAAVAGTPAAPAGQRTAPQAAPVEARGGVGGVMVGLLALIFAAGSFALLVDRMDRTAQDTTRRLADLGQGLARTERTQETLLASLATRFSESEARIHGARDAKRQALVEELQALRADVTRQTGQTAAIGEDIAALRVAIEDGSKQAKQRMDALDTRVKTYDADLEFFKNRLIEFEETLRNAARPGAALLGEQASNDTTDGARAWNGLLLDLSHTNPGIRLEAIYALGETGDKAVVPYLIPMLSDEDLFVRMATARMLQDLKAREAVPSLIDTLEDPQSAVREAAMVSLRELTGREFRFEPLASEAERAKRVKAWREWWAEAGADFLAGS